MGMMVDAVVVNAYWFSYPVIGFALLNLISRSAFAPLRIRSLAKFIVSQNILLAGLGSFVLAVAAIGIVAFFGYLVRMPVFILSGWYILLLALATGFFAVKLWGHLFSKQSLDVFRLKDQPLIAKLAFSGFILFLVIDFAIAIYARSHAALGSDTYVHLSRIVAILSQGLTIESGFFNNVPEVGYHMNLVYALYAIPCQLFGFTPTDVWEFSFGFFRLLQWLGIFALAWYVCRYWLRDKVNTLLFASLAGMFAVAYFCMAFYIAVYPNQFVGLWLLLFVIALSHYEFQSSKAAALPTGILAFLITFTHPTYAVMSILFVGLVYIVKLIFRRQTFVNTTIKQTTKFYAVIIGILSLAPLRSALMPNHMTEAGVSILKYDTLNLGFLKMKQPEIILHGKVGIALTFMGIFGSVFVLYKLWAYKRQWAIACSLILFYTIMVYVPFTFTVLQAVFPIWIIDRFTAMNVLTYITLPIGFYGIIWALQTIIIRSNKKSMIWLRSDKVLPITLSVILVVLSAHYMVHAPSKVAQFRDENEHYYEFMDRTHATFRDVLNDEKIVVAHTGDSYLLASVLPIDVIAIEETHTTPSADAKDRSNCQKELMQNLDYEDLKAVHADYIVLATYEPTFMREKTIAEHSPYLRFVKGNADYYVYKFLPSKGSSTEKPMAACTMYQKVESSKH